MGSLFQKTLVEPLTSALIFLYQTVALQDLGLAIIFLTIIIRLILAPLFYKSLKSQAVMQKLQPDIVRIQKDHKEDKEKQARALMDLYKRNKINPLSGFLLILIQLPILIALYQVFLNPPPELNGLSLNLINLKETSIIVVALAALFQYFQGRLSLPRNGGNEMAKNIVLLGPVITIAVLAYLPSAVGVYWLATTLFSIGQQLYVNKKIYGAGSKNNS